MGNGNIADSLFQAKEYFQASIEYERIIFHSKSRTTTNKSLYQKAVCYQHLEKYPKALEVLQTIYFNTPNDTLYSLVTYQQAFCHYLNNEPINALLRIEEYIQRTQDSTTYLNFIPLKVLCNNQLQEWDKAYADLSFFILSLEANENTKSYYLLTLDSLYSKQSIPRIVKVKKAQNLSRFIPGSGQIYAGKVDEGIVNFLIHASVLAFAAHQFYHQYYFTAYLGGLGLLNQIYTGGIKRAGVLANRNNTNNINQFNRTISELIQRSVN